MTSKEQRKMGKNVLGRGLSALISSAPVSVVPRVPREANTTAAAPRAEPSFGSIETSNAARALSAAPDPSIADSPTDSASLKDAASLANPKVVYIDILTVTNNPLQPRREFKEAELKELSESIKTLGVLQPVLLRKGKNDFKYEIVAGERRWRAAKLAELKAIPAIILELTDREALEIAIVENIQREDLNPVEEALAYQRLVDEFSLGQKEIAEKVGKDRASIANYLRLLKLPQQVLDMIKDAKLSMGHAKAILSIKEPQAQLSLAKKVVAEELSVRALEAIVSRAVVLDAGKRLANHNENSNSSSPARSAFPEVVEKMRRMLGTKVTIRHHNSGRGRVEIEYFSEQELDRIVDTICR